jgi:hypothetical protein
MKFNKIINFIKKHASEECPKECCGFIVEKDNDFYCIKSENIAKIPTRDFKIKASDFIDIKNNYNILYIYHSHCDKKYTEFSPKDIICSDAIGINYLLYINNADIYKIYETNSFSKKYIGRIYQYKKYDCLSLIIDFLKNEFNIFLNSNPIYDFIDKNGSLNVDLTETTKKVFLESNKFIKIEDFNEIKKYDIFLMKNHLNTPCHFSIYLGDNKILHHTVDRFSRIENYCNSFKKRTILGLRMTN